MLRNARDLLNAGLYISALGALAGGIVLGGALLGEKVIASAAVQTVASIFEAEAEPPSRLSVVVANAREIRAALERPMPPRPALQPLTQQVAYGALRPGAKGAHVATSSKSKVPKLSKEGMDAMASMDTRSYVAPSVELHRIY